MKKAIKLFLNQTLFLFLILSPLINFGQSNTFINNISTQFDQQVNAAIEIPNEGYILSTNDVVFGKFVTKLVKINIYGDTVKTCIIYNTDDRSLLQNLVRSSDNTYLAIGSARNASLLNNKLWVLQFDKELNILSEKKYPVPFTIFNTSFCMDHFNNLIVNGWYDNTDYINYEDVFIFKLSIEGDSLGYYYLQSPGMQISMSIMEKMDSTGYYMPIWGRFNPTCSPYLSNMVELDYNFNITFEDSISNDVGFNNNIRKFNDHQYLICGQTFIPFMPYDNEFIALEKLDSYYATSNYIRIGPYQVDTTTYTARYKSLDFIDTNNIFLGGTVNYRFPPQPNSRSYLILAKLNSSLIINWQFFYGFDKYYELYGILATSDGGCLLLATYFNFLATNYEEDIIYIKVNSDGLITDRGEDSNAIAHSAIAYPNPGTDCFTIQSGPQISGAQFTLYDMQGRPVLAEKLTGTQLRVNTSGLSTGTYPWQIVYKNKVVESGKWVKE